MAKSVNRTIGEGYATTYTSVSSLGYVLMNGYPQNADDRIDLIVGLALLNALGIVSDMMILGDYKKGLDETSSKKEDNHFSMP